MDITHAAPSALDDSPDPFAPAPRGADLGPGPLSTAQLERYREDGFLVLDSPVLPPAEIQWARDLLLALFEERARRNDGVLLNLAAARRGEKLVSPQILNPSTYEPRMKRLSFRPVAHAMAAQLLGAPVTLCGEHAVLKPPRHGAPTPWHQDEAFRDPAYNYRQVSLWIALTPVAADSGPMVYLPGSHRGEVLPHRLLGERRRASTVECASAIDEKLERRCPIPAGGVLLHDVRTLHRALPNTSAEVRLGYILIFEAAPIRRHDNRTFAWRAQLERNRRRQRLQGLLRGGLIAEPLRKARAELSSGRSLSDFTPERVLRWARAFMTGGL